MFVAIIKAFLYQQSFLLALNDDYDGAAKLYRQASKRGNLDAYHNLAQLYLFNKCCCRDRDKTAVRMLTYCAERGNLNSQRALGKMYRDGQHVKKDLAMAMYWYLKAASQNDMKSAFAAFNIKDDGSLLDKVVTLSRAKSESPKKNTSS